MEIRAEPPDAHDREPSDEAFAADAGGDTISWRELLAETSDVLGDATHARWICETATATIVPMAINEGSFAGVMPHSAAIANVMIALAATAPPHIGTVTGFFALAPGARRASTMLPDDRKAWALYNE